MKLLKRVLLFSALPALLSGCKKNNDPTIDDQFLNYTIPIIPATKDYTVGAFYVNTGATFNPNIKETPSVGKYTYVNGVLAPAIMVQHIEYAKKAKINYLIFPVNSAMLQFTAYNTDSILLNSFLNASNSADMNFALSYNFSTTAGGTINVNVPIESLPAKLEGLYKDFQRMAFYFKKANYMKVDGKMLVIINNAYNLAANSNPAIYTEIRRRLSLLGFELYIVGMQDAWTPPQRYFYRFVNCVDALYEATMVQAGITPDRVYLFAQTCDQNYKYWKESLAKDSIDFIPSISPAYNYNILAPSSINLNINRTADGGFFRTYCNIAKGNAPKNNLIFIETFNDFARDTQIEPAQSYGELYLNIVREELKMK